MTMKFTVCFFIACAGTFLLSCSRAQETMDFEKYDPVSTLVVPEHHITRARFPFIDVHGHQSNMNSMDLSGLITVMDTINMMVMVNLSGDSGSKLKAMKGNVDRNYPKRFMIFANIGFNGISDPGWTEKTVEQLEEDGN